MSVERYPGRFAVEAPDRPAVVSASTGRMQTFAELDAGARRLAALLRDRGFVPGDHVVVLLENHFRFLEVAWGCHYAGLVYTTCSTKLTSGEIGYVVEDSGSRALVTSGALSDVATGLVSTTPQIRLRLILDIDLAGHERYETVVDPRPDEPVPVGRVAGRDMLYSSGTTGRPKGIVRTAAALPLETAPVGVSYAAKRFFGFDDDTVYLATTPLYHGAGVRFCMAANALGGTVVYLDRFDAEGMLDAVARHRVTHTQVVPTMLQRLVDLPEEVRAGADVSSLRRLIHSAAPISPRLKHQVIDWFGPIVQEYYAGTESNGVVLCDTDEWLAHEGTVGRPVGCRIHICDQAGNPLPPHESGTVYFDGGGEFSYHGDPGKTAGSRDPRSRGWSTLGDIGHVDEDGFLYLTDRAAFMIISGGVNVYPAETEQHLMSHPEVRDVAVFGVPHTDLGEQVVAVVQLAQAPPDQDAEERAREELHAFCRSSLSPVKCPRILDIVTTLPRDDTGKLRKKHLQESWIQAHPSPQTTTR